MTTERPSSDSNAFNTVAGPVDNVVQAAAIHGGIHFNQAAPYNDLHDVVRRAHDESLSIYRRLDEVQTQLSRVQQQLLDSVRAERNIAQVVLILQFLVMRLQDMVTQLTGQRDHYRLAAGSKAADLVRTHRELAEARQSTERAQRQLDRALDERALAIELIVALQRKVDALEQLLRELHPDIRLAKDVMTVRQPSSGPPPVNVGGDLDGVDVVVDHIETYLDEQSAGLSRIAETVGSPSPQHITLADKHSPATTMRQPASRDELTGLLNRYGAMKLLRELLSSTGPAGSAATAVAVLLCDLDDFKRVNDALGHAAGDELLVALALRLERELPLGTTAARVSGDEFLIICADIASFGSIERLASRIFTLIRAAVPVSGQLIRVTACIGAASSQEAPAPMTGEDLLRFADAAVFQAKVGGAGRFALASPALIASADQQIQMEGELRDALTAADGLAVHFQPVVTDEGLVTTAEALVRWPHQERGLLRPADFLPVAARGGLLRELDQWMLRTALRQAVGWPLHVGRPVAVAVNLSGLLPGDPQFVDAVTDSVIESGIAWDRVVLELVETALVDLPSKTLIAMADLIGRGVRFALDDFGTGYSSLSRLRDLPVQIIKMDRTFVAGVGSDSSDFAVASAVVDISHAMSRVCVAQGVENATQFHVLRSMGVDAFQGWLFSREMPDTQFSRLLQQGHLPVPDIE